MSSQRGLHRLTVDLENVDNTERRIAEFRRNLQAYEEMSHQNSTSDPDSGYGTAVPESATFIADPDSPHLAPSPRLHPNITTRARNRNGRRLSGLLGISHRGRHNRTPTFDHDNRPKISRPIVDQGEIGVPNNGPYIYNHPSRPRLDVEIPRSSFSDLWGQRYGPIGDEGYNVDHQRDVRNTQSMDLGRLAGGRENYRYDTRRYGVSLGGIADWNALVTANRASGSPVSPEDEERNSGAEEDDVMDVSYLAPLVSPTPASSSTSISTASASLPSISNLPPLPPSTVALNEGHNPPPAPEEYHPRALTPLSREPSERWIRHPLRQNPPFHRLPLPPPPPSSPILYPSTPSPVPHWPSLQHFRPSCGVVIANIGTTAMVQPFIVAPDEGESSVTNNDDESFTLLDNDSFGVESYAPDDEEVVQVREDTPPPPPVQRRLFVDDATTSTTPSPPQYHHRRRSGSVIGGLRSLCCGLLPRRSRSQTTTSSPQTQPSAPLSQTRVPISHTTIPEEDEEEDNDQENQPPTITETLVESNNEHVGEVEQNQEQEEQEQAEGGASRRHSVRHSWVTVSRWLE
ncbi:hypothetical protein QM012_002667 [Aureobasidium pullulans]|uniref:Uncharacterized protein n=1 Tax=Aureobasidium pullulans TaxID=5580 RepID=A0ABR0TA69_AURPU